MTYGPRCALPVRFDHQPNDFPSGHPHSVNKYILLTEYGRAGLENIWLSVRTYGPRWARSVRPDLKPNIFPSGPPTQSVNKYILSTHLPCCLVSYRSYLPTYPPTVPVNVILSATCSKTVLSLVRAYGCLGCYLANKSTKDMAQLKQLTFLFSSVV